MRHIGDPKIKQRAARKTVLLTKIWKPGEDVLIDVLSCGVSVESPIVGRVVVVEKQASDHNIAGSDVDLSFRQIASAPELIAIRIIGQPRDDDVVVFGFEPVEEPRFVLGDWSGEGHSRHKFVEVQALHSPGGTKERSRWR